MTLDFQPLRLEDITLLRPYFDAQPSRACDSTIGGTFLWRDYFQTAYTLWEGSLLLQSRMPNTGEPVYSVPMGGDPRLSLDGLAAHCREAGHPLKLFTVPEEALPQLLARWPQAQVSKLPQWADYLYQAQDLCQLQGKKYAGQRNHIRQFCRRYPDWQFAPLTPENLHDARAFFRRFEAQRDKDSETFHEDTRKVEEVLENFQLYGFLSGGLWVDGQMIAMAIGEVVGDTLYDHIEKADTSYHGAYQMIVQQFSQYACGEGVAYINREDDAGDEGLRKSKLAWRPCALLEKYLVQVE